ncbi:MAG TPA: phosphopantetheine-binding protein [Ferruginibacter sp.]|nr:phosphopantetheine-binding protein [Ferruginibacter sp.]HQR00537.1 phosphopantetheine-binding protein [Ferruginibacter sp.]
MDEQSIINEIKHYVEKNILAPSVTIDADTDLKSAGIDSFSTVEILLFIERKYGTAIPDDKLIPENFRTLRTLASTVHGLMA